MCFRGQPRFEALSPGAKKVYTALIVMGGPILRELVERDMPFLSRAALARALDELYEADLLREEDGSVYVWSFKDEPVEDDA